jgi:siroheme synthase-like protein
MLDVSQRLIVIIGGGGVAVRKARGLIDAGATRIEVVSPRLDPAMPAGVTHLAETYHARHLEGAGLVFAATDSPAVNAQVVRDARALNLLVHRADADEEFPGDFTTPAVAREGTLVVAVSAGSAALAVYIRDRIAQRLEPLWGRMSEAMRRLRPALRNHPALDPAQRRALLRDLASDAAFDALAAGGLPALCDWLRAKNPELANLPTPES